MLETEEWCESLHIWRRDLQTLIYSSIWLSDHWEPTFLLLRRESRGFFSHKIVFWHWHWRSPKKNSWVPTWLLYSQAHQSKSPTLHTALIISILVLYFSTSLLNMIRQPKPIRHLKKSANGTSRDWNKHWIKKGIWENRPEHKQLKENKQTIITGSMKLQNKNKGTLKRGHSESEKNVGNLKV